MDPQATASGAPSWPQQRAPKRQRGKKKSKVAVIIPSAALIPSEEQLLLDDRKRAKSERKLVEDTVMRLRRISADHKREWERLFRHKSALPNSHRERAEDDRLRRAAVLKIMEAREKAGIEPVGAAVQWAELGSADIATELNKKFDKQHFSEFMLSPKTMISSVYGLTKPVQKILWIDLKPRNPSAGSWTGPFNSQTVRAFQPAELNGSGRY